MAIQIGAKHDSGFDDPIGMLTDCHRRIERFVHIFFRVAEQAGERALTSDASQRAALRGSGPEDSRRVDGDGVATQSAPLAHCPAESADGQ